MKQWISDNKTVLLISCLALLVRIGYLIELSYQPDFLLPMVDEKFHWLWAADILNNSFWGESSYFRAPLYGYFLAFLYWVSSGSIFMAKLLQLFLTFGTSFFLIKTTQHLFGKPTSYITGFIYAFYGTLIFYESMFLIPAIFLFLLSYGLYRVLFLSESTTIKDWLITGIVFGLAAIARPNILLVMPFLMLWMLLSLQTSKELIQRIKLPLALCLGLVLVIAPVTIRNVVVTGEFILISSQGGINLYLGNNRDTDGLTMLMPDVVLDESVSWSEFETVTHKSAERQAFKKLTNAEASAFWSKKAVAYILENPTTFLSNVWKKSVYLVSGIENSDNGDIYYHRTKSKLFSLLVWNKFIYFPFGLLLPFALVGFYVSRNKFKKVLPLYIYLLLYIPSIILFLVTARHRLPLVIVLIIFAAAGISFFYEKRKQFISKTYLFSIGIFIVSLFLLNQQYFDQKEIGGQGAEFQTFFNEGIQFEKLGDLQNALASYQKADRAFSSSATLVNNLGFVQYRLSKFKDAELNFIRSINLDKSFAAAYNNYGLLKQKTGNLDSALTLYQSALTYFKNDSASNENISMVYTNIADLYDQRKDITAAAKTYLQALKQSKTYRLARSRAASFYARNKMFTKSDSLYTVSEQQNNMEASDFFNWGLSYMRRNKIANGIVKLQNCIEKDSLFYQAYHLIGYGMYTQQAPKEAVLIYLDKTLSIEPNFKQAIDLRKEVLKK